MLVSEARKPILVRGARQLLTMRGPSGPRRGSAMRELGLITDGALLIVDGIIRDIGPSRRVENLAAAREADEISADGRVVLPGFVDSLTNLVCGPPLLDEYEERCARLENNNCQPAGSEKTLQVLRSSSKQRLELDARKTLREFVSWHHIDGGYGHLRPRSSLRNESPARTGGGHQQTPRHYSDVSHRFRLLTGGRRRRWRIQCARHPRRIASAAAGAFCRCPVRTAWPASRRGPANTLLGQRIRFSDQCYDGYGGAVGWRPDCRRTERGQGEPGRTCRGRGYRTAGPFSNHRDTAAGNGVPHAMRSLPARKGTHRPCAAVAIASEFSSSHCPTCSMPAILSLACNQMHLTPAEAITAAHHQWCSCATVRQPLRIARIRKGSRSADAECFRLPRNTLSFRNEHD